MTEKGSNDGLLMERSEVEGGNTEVENVIDIDKWVSSLSRILEDVPQYMCIPGHKGRISRIPENLREINRKAYEPYILSIGPYYHGNSRVEHMEKRKQLVLKCVLENRPELTLRKYLKEIKSIELAARSFYSDVDMDSAKFVQMLLIDGLYIVTMFCGVTRSQNRMDRESTITGKDTNHSTNLLNKGSEEPGDNTENVEMMGIAEPTDETSSDENNVDSPRWFWGLFAHDLFLLENQLPFFVLQKIFDIIYSGSGKQLVDIMKYNVGNRLLKFTNVDLEMEISPTEEVHHLLHLCHMFLRPRFQQKPNTLDLTESRQMFRLGNAVQLYKAGVGFEPRSDSSPYTLLDISFGPRGKMAMPCLHFDDNIDSLLRNLIALEQMKYPQLGLEISSYVVLLLHLVTTPEDVKLLRRKGIIHHHLASDKEMVHLVNHLSVGLSFDYVEDNYSLKPLFLELKRHTDRKIPGWRAWLKHRYFRNPWTVISLLAAFLLLLMSATQTYYVVYSYYYPRLG